MPRASATAERSVLTGKFLWLLFLWRKPSCRIGTRCQFRMSCRSKISKTAIMVATILSPRKSCPLTLRTWVYSHPKTRTSYVYPAYDAERLLTNVTQTSLFLTSLSPSSTEQSIRTRVLKSLPSVQPSQLKSVVHIAKTRFVA